MSEYDDINRIGLRIGAVIVVLVIMAILFIGAIGGVITTELLRGP